MQKACLIFIALFAITLAETVELEKPIQSAQTVFEQRLLQIKTQSSYALQDVLDLLAELRDAAARELDSLHQTWAKESHALQETITELRQAIDNQRQQCGNLENDLETLQNQLADSHTHIKWINARTREINELSEKLAEQRCELSLIHI
eukprot:TRINITY_DN18965_c0_g1_i1.p2 TRINITY_DN18965_c0_g1~~TRINITY_DN18965_c0_g1_i1.p2  ORF type:complete len:149 (-),score=69.26 TRINITY_DN18965_c0_g1_i1:59-505(-)